MLPRCYWDWLARDVKKILLGLRPRSGTSFELRETRAEEEVSYGNPNASVRMTSGEEREGEPKEGWGRGAESRNAIRNVHCSFSFLSWRSNGFVLALESDVILVGTRIAG